MSSNLLKIYDTGEKKRENMRTKNKTKRKIRWKHILPFYVMVLPGLLYLLIDKYIPMFGVLIAFKKLDFQKGILGSPWCGFDNFRFLFQSNEAWVITRNTILYNVGFFLVNTVLSIVLAILINEIRSKRAVKFYQTSVLLPFLMSWVVIGYLVYAYLSAESGLINASVLQPLGYEKIAWYQDKRYWPFILIFVNAWKGVGYSMIIYLSSIVGISQDYYEAARLDGASKWKQIRTITLPLLKPTVLTLMILAAGQMFRSDFGLFYQIPRNSGILYDVTRTIDVYVYQALMKNSDYGMSSAASVYQSIVGFVLIVAVNKLAKKYNPESSIF